MKYTAINIGPIIKTLGMARKPRELWAASYLFSYLMKCIFEETEKMQIKIVSPAKPEGNTGKSGIYPDRIFLEACPDANSIIKNATTAFCNNVGLGEEQFKEYFNVMSVSSDADSYSKAIEKLNQLLDVMELCCYAADKEASDSIYQIIAKKKKSPLFQLASGEDKMPIPDLETIAKAQWIAHPETKIRSHHKYICVVQADGDNVGKTVSHPNLRNENLQAISKALVKYGIEATKIIDEFGGLPIYAGGDDLLFIAPVVGKDGTNIFDLLVKIETDAFVDVKNAVLCSNLAIEASLSFGVSITYYKYPLYEALESARNLLFKVAKKTDRFPNKNAVAWSFRKHSGGAFDAAFSQKNKELEDAFKNLIKSTTKDTVVSAVAHKIREFEPLVKIVLRSDDKTRLDALFDKTLEFQDNEYFNSVKKIMPLLYKEIQEDDYVSMLYSLLRTAKFIKGEDLRDE